MLCRFQLVESPFMSNIQLANDLTCQVGISTNPTKCKFIFITEIIKIYHLSIPKYNTLHQNITIKGVSKQHDVQSMG